MRAAPLQIFELVSKGLCFLESKSLSNSYPYFFSGHLDLIKVIWMRFLEQGVLEKRNSPLGYSGLGFLCRVSISNEEREGPLWHQPPSPYGPVHLTQLLH